MQLKIIFGFGSIGGLLGILWVLLNNPSLIGSSLENLIVISFGWLAFMSLSSVIVIFGILSLVFLEMFVPALQKRITKLKHTITEAKSTIKEAHEVKEEVSVTKQELEEAKQELAFFREELIFAREELTKVKSEIAEIHSTEPCLVLRDFVKEVAESKEPTPSQELMNEVVQLRTQVKSLHDLRREDSDKIRTLEAKLEQEKKETDQITSEKIYTHQSDDTKA